MKKLLASYRIVFGVAISTPSGDQMNDPAQEPGRSDPGYASQNQPDNTDQDPSVVDLAHAGNQETQYSC